MSNYRYKITKAPARPRSKRYGTATVSISGGGYRGTATETITVEGHTHGNMDVLNRLSRNGLYVVWDEGDGTEAVRAWAGYADLSGWSEKSEHSVTSDMAEDARLWDGHEWDDWMEQPVRTTDDVTFGSVTASSFGNAEFVPDIVGGYGFRVEQDPVTKRATLYADDMVLRGGLRVVEVDIQKVDSVGGLVLVSQAASQVRGQVKVNGKIGVELDLRKGETSVSSPYQITGCPFEVGDFVRWGRLDRETGAYRAGWSEITEILTIDGEEGKRYILLLDYETRQGIATEDGAEVCTEDFLFTVSTEASGEGLPDSGDNVVLMGSRNEGRDGFLVISAEDGQPHISAYAGVNTMALSKPAARFGSLEGIFDTTFGRLKGYGLWSDNVYLSGLFRLRNAKGVDMTIDEVISLAVEGAGIDIAKGRIVATADNFVVKNSEGKETMAIDANGMLKTQLINASEIQVNQVTCFDRNEPDIITSTYNREGRGELTNYYRDQKGGVLIPATIQEWEEDTGVLVKGYDANGVLAWTFGRNGFQTVNRDWSFIRIALSGPAESNGWLAELVGTMQELPSADYFRLAYPASEEDGLVYTSESLGADAIPDGTYYDPKPIARIEPGVTDLPIKKAYRNWYRYQGGRLVENGRININY